MEVVYMGQIKITLKILVRKPEEKRSLEKCRCKWEDNIKMTHKETGQEGVGWRHTVLERVGWWAS